MTPDGDGIAVGALIFLGYCFVIVLAIVLLVRWAMRTNRSKQTNHFPSQKRRSRLLGMVGLGLFIGISTILLFFILLGAF